MSSDAGARNSALPELDCHGRRPTLKERACQQSLYLEPEVYECVREIAFRERTKIHRLLLEGVDLVLAKRAGEHAAIDPRAFNLHKACYSVQETLAVLGTCASTLYKMVRAGRLHPRKEGKKTLFFAHDLARYLASLPEK